MRFVVSYIIREILSNTHPKGYSPAYLIFEKSKFRNYLLPQKPSEIASDQSVSSSKGGVLGIVFN